MIISLHFCLDETCVLLNSFGRQFGKQVPQILIEVLLRLRHHRLERRLELSHLAVVDFVLADEDQLQQGILVGELITVVVVTALGESEVEVVEVVLVDDQVVVGPLAGQVDEFEGLLLELVHHFLELLLVGEPGGEVIFLGAEEEPFVEVQNLRFEVGDFDGNVQ